LSALLAYFPAPGNRLTWRRPGNRQIGSGWAAERGSGRPLASRLAVGLAGGSPVSPFAEPRGCPATAGLPVAPMFSRRAEPRGFAPPQSFQAAPSPFCFSRGRIVPCRCARAHSNDPILHSSFGSHHAFAWPTLTFLLSSAPRAMRPPLWCVQRVCLKQVVIPHVFAIAHLHTEEDCRNSKCRVYHYEI
jgi:hypothetical protein